MQKYDNSDDYVDDIDDYVDDPYIPITYKMREAEAITKRKDYDGHLISLGAGSWYHDVSITHNDW